MDPWPHQTYAVEETTRKEEEGFKRILLTSPTGGGKTFVAANKIKRWIDEGHRVGLYTNRRALVDQLSRMLDEYGIDHGLRASNKAENHELAVQVCSIQTELARKKKAKKSSGVHRLHECTRVLVDEAHLNAGPGMMDILNEHVSEGATYTGLTATPIDLGHAYQTLVQAGTTSELRACGALLPALHFAPDEPDLAAFKRLKKKLANIAADTATITEAQASELIMTPTIFGRVYEWYERLNPEHEPTILFAPDVKGSKWFAEKFEASGVKACHIEADEIWLDGKEHHRTTKLFDEVMARSRDEGLLLCNRFVLREGVDAPWLKHGILATIFGSLSTYLQSIGRILRAHPSMDHVRIQDHGGNYWRWGSPNADRRWDLEYTDSWLKARRADRIREGKESEPFVCPECKLVLIAGRCPNCHWRPVSWTKARAVVSTDGSLKLMYGDVYRPHRICEMAIGPKKWMQIFWASRKNKPTRTFRAAMVLFAQDTNWTWPDPSWPWMPTQEDDWYRAIADVPLSRLVQPDGDSSNGDSRGGECEGAEEANLFSQWEE